MKVIGVTGGIGAGKSTIIQIAKENFEIAVIMTDEVARRQMEPGGCSFQEVVQTFGSKILDSNGWIDRKILASIVFQDENRLKILNQITHPKVWDETVALIQKYDKETTVKAVLVETALLFDAGFDRLCDETWYIDAKEATRKERLMKSRGYSKEKVDEIFKNQSLLDYAKKHSDYVIQNEDDTKKEVTIQILRARIEA